MNPLPQQKQSNKPAYGGGIHYPGMSILETDPDSVQSSEFEKWYGAAADVLGIRQNAGYYDADLGFTVPYWTVIMTDLLKSRPDAGTGLASETDPWVASITRHLIPALMRNPINSIWPGDVHLNKAYWNQLAVSKRVLDETQLSPNERARVEANPVLKRKLENREPLTVGEIFYVIGEVLSDKEDRNFIPHAQQGLVEYVPSVQAYLRYAAQQALFEQESQGLAHPVPRAYTEHKAGLLPITLSDEFGMGGNNIYSLLRGFYHDWWTEGPEHRGQKVVLMGGTAVEYTLEMLGLLLFDLDFFVVVVMPWTGSMGVDSTLAWVEKMSNRYGKKILFTWDWPPEWQFGPKPADFDSTAALMKAQMVLEELGPDQSRFRDAYQIMLDEWTAINGARARVQDQIEAAKNAGQFNEVARLEQQMPAPAPMFVDRFVREVTETQANGAPLFLSMDEIVAYLRAGGNI